MRSPGPAARVGAWIDGAPGQRWPLWLLPIAALYLVFALERLWVAEDAYITFRYAQQVVEGHGLRFNAADPAPVEGYSNSLWLLWAVVQEGVGIPASIGANAVSVACGLLVGLVVARTARRHLELGVVPTLAAVGLLAGFAPFAVWSTSGLEVMPQTLCFLCAAVWLTFGERPRDHHAAGAAALGLALLRIEGIAWLPVIAAGAAAVRAYEGREVRRPLVRFAAVPLVLYALFTAWRVYAFGSLASHTMQAKLGGALGVTLSRGLRYVGLSAVSLLVPLLLPLAVAAAARGPRLRARWLWIGALALALPAWSVTVGGDYMRMYRFLVPSAPFLALCIGGLVQALPLRAGVALAGAAALAGNLPVHGVWIVPASALQALTTVSGDSAFVGGTFQFATEERPHDIEHLALAAFVEPGDSVVLAAIGRNGYHTRAHLIDQCGLVARQPELAARRAERVGRRAGHDSCLAPPAFAYLEPDVLAFTSFRAVPGADADLLMHTVRRLRKHDTQSGYYPDFVAVPLDDGELLYGVGLRRAVYRAEREAGWQRYRAALRELRRAGGGSG